MLPLTVMVGAGVVLAGRLVVRSQRQTSSITGEQQYVGKLVTIRQAGGSRGQALVDGAWWNVRSDGTELKAGQQARVTGYDGLDLLVQPVEQVEAVQQAEPVEPVEPAVPPPANPEVQP
jgi:membrane-bound serine protease (ClpP class)